MGDDELSTQRPGDRPGEDISSISFDLHARRAVRDGVNMQLGPRTGTMATKGLQRGSIQQTPPTPFGVVSVRRSSKVLASLGGETSVR